MKTYITETSLRNIINGTLNEIKQLSDSITYYVVDDGGVYNVFGTDQFDENGRYFEDPSITFDDLDIIEEFNDMNEAFDFCEEMNDTSGEYSL